jgi:HlyD family secretion protein
MNRALLFVPIAALALLLAACPARKLMSGALPESGEGVPVTTVKRGTVTFLVTARGELHGGNTEMLTVPMVGGATLTITTLHQDGDEVEAGGVVVAFDTAEQELKLREAEADLAEAEQQVVQTQAENQAKEEETKAQLVQARTDLRVAELECRRNELVPRIQARQNDLAVQAARDKLRQIESDLANRRATAAAGIALQEAARAKAKVKSAMARRNIDSMTLKSKTGGYVALQPNTEGMVRWGMQAPIFQVGDTVRPGLAVAQIPDLKSWEASARIGELDRGHLAEGQPTQVRVVALPGRTFRGKVKTIGGTTGPPWERRFDCRIALLDPSPDLRPGMSVVLSISTGTLDNVLWIPAQALFERDGRPYVYLRSGSVFLEQDVKMVRRSEDRVVITGLRENQQVALASPDQSGKKEAPRGAMQAIPKL